MSTPRLERFVDLGRSTVPPGRGSAFGSSPHPYVVQLSVTGPRPHLAVSTGSGHLGSGRVLPLAEAFLASGDLDPTWAEEFAGAGATWALPLLRELLAGATATEQEVIEAYRARHGHDPQVERLPVG